MIDDDRPVILHVFADYGVEGEVLAGYGRVIRASINPKSNTYDEHVVADATAFPFDDDVADLVVCHPPCSPWSPLGEGGGEKLVSTARAICQRCGGEYIIENVPACDELRDPVTLRGDMFGLPIRYERAFETSFPTDPPPPTYPMGTFEPECGIRERRFKTKQWWLAAKGYVTPRNSRRTVGISGVPAPYVHWLCRQWLAATGNADREPGECHVDVNWRTARAKAKAAAEPDPPGIQTKFDGGALTVGDDV